MNDRCAYSTHDRPAFPDTADVMSVLFSYGAPAAPRLVDWQKMREALICEHIPYVKAIVNRLAWRLPPHVELDDLINAGIVGLIKAVDSFDPSRQTKLATYARYRIHGAVLSELRERDFLTRTDRKRIKDLERAYETLEKNGLDTVTDEAIAEEMGIDIDEVQQLQGLSQISFVSAEEMGLSGEERDYEQELIERGEVSEGDGFTHVRLQEIREALAHALERLPEKEQMVLSLYYQDELTMKEIGEVLNLTESRVSQIHSQAIARLRRSLKREEMLEG